MHVCVNGVTRTAALVKFATPQLFIQQEVLHPARRLHDRTLAALSKGKEHQHFVINICQLQFMQSAVLGVMVEVKGQLCR